MYEELNEQGIGEFKAKNYEFEGGDQVNENKWKRYGSSKESEELEAYHAQHTTDTIASHDHNYALLHNSYANDDYLRTDQRINEKPNFSLRM